MRRGQVGGRIALVKSGYGFIEGDDGVRYFFFYNALDTFGPRFRDLSVDMRVEFTPLADDRRPSAIEVRVVGGHRAPGAPGNGG